MDDERVLLRVDEAARACGMSRSAAYEAIRRGDLPSVRIGRSSLRVPVDALRRVIDERTTGAGRTADADDRTTAGAA